MLMRTKKGVVSVSSPKEAAECAFQVNVEKIWHHEDIELEAVERRFYNQMTDFIELVHCQVLGRHEI